MRVEILSHKDTHRFLYVKETFVYQSLKEAF